MTLCIAPRRGLGRLQDAIDVERLVGRVQRRLGEQRGGHREWLGVRGQDKYTSRDIMYYSLRTQAVTTPEQAMIIAELTTQLPLTAGYTWLFIRPSKRGKSMRPAAARTGNSAAAPGLRIVPANPEGRTKNSINRLSRNR